MGGGRSNFVLRKYLESHEGNGAPLECEPHLLPFLRGFPVDPCNSESEVLVSSTRIHDGRADISPATASAAELC